MADSFANEIADGRSGFVARGAIGSPMAETRQILKSRVICAQGTMARREEIRVTAECFGVR
jgi:hypothetical protein